MKKILIYAGRGVSQQALKQLIAAFKSEGVENHYSLESVDNKRLSQGDWEEEAALLVIPGGRDTYYQKKLSGKGNARIRKWVHEGGTFLGICAGAYYGCHSIEFERGTPLEITAPRELCFFPGVARGPAYGTGLFSYSDESGACLSSLKWEACGSTKEKVLLSYFNGGCTFVDVKRHANTRVLASYADLEGAPPAIIECMVGDGKAILSGVHPEFLGDQLIPSPVKESLIKGESLRQELFRALLERLIALPNKQ